jgi:phosphoglucosamine mutase
LRLLAWLLGSNGCNAGKCAGETLALPGYGEKLMVRMFGTDGVRGIANLFPVTPEMALNIGRAAAHICKSSDYTRHRIVVGNDTRLSGGMLESALAAGFCSMGFDVFLAGALPTPGIAFMTRSMGMDAGVVISASHNPFQDNGIKFFTRRGYKLPDSQEDEIERLIVTKEIKDLRPTGREIGKVRQIHDAAEQYAAFCKKAFPANLSLRGTRIVLDCANGATSGIAPLIFRELGAEVTAIHCMPDGVNINDRCGSQHIEDLAAKVLETGSNLGLAFDGDGDRMIAVDEKGRELTGDHILAICGKMYKEQGRLRNNLVVSTIMSNYGFMAAMSRLGIEHAASAVGDRYVLEMMKEKEAVIGGEPSGHMIFLEHHTAGDGIISALQLLAAMLFEGKPLYELSQVIKMSPQKIINVDVKSKPPLESLSELQERIRMAEAELNCQGRVLIRYSGTQSMCRVMVEGPTEEMTERLARELAEAVKNCIG